MYSRYIEEIKKRLGEKRFYHSLCVAEEARRLAAKYGANPDKADLAGILHDITKEQRGVEQLEMMGKYGLEFSQLELFSEKLWHAKTGAALAEHELLIDDREILDAIRYHTTGRAGMTLPEKVLFLADFTSKDRDYEDVEVMRSLADESMDAAILYALKYTIKDLLRKEKAVHPDTLAAYNEITMKRGQSK